MSKETKNKIANAYVNGYWKGFRDGFYFIEEELKEFDPCAWHKDLRGTFTCAYCQNTKSNGFYVYAGDPFSMTKPTTQQSLDKGDRVKSGGTLTTATTDTVDYSTTDIEHLKKNGLITETATEIEKWTKAIKEASSYEGKLYARNKLREVKNG